MIEQLLTKHLDTWTQAVETKSAVGRGSSKKLKLHGIAKLRELILELAVRGQLVPQDESDEPASVLLERVIAEKKRFVEEKKLRKQKTIPPITEEEIPFEIPNGWEFVRLDEIGITSVGLTYSPKDISDVGTPVLRSSNIQKGRIDLNDLVRVQCDVKESLLVSDGDLLICARNGSKALVGKTAMISDLSEPMAFGAFMAIYRSSCNQFLEVFLNSPVFRYFLEGVNTTTINQITQGKLKATIAPIPPEEEQKRIVGKVEELMALCDALEREQESVVVKYFRTTQWEFRIKLLEHLIKSLRLPVLNNRYSYEHVQYCST